MYYRDLFEKSIRTNDILSASLAIQKLHQEGNIDNKGRLGHTILIDAIKKDNIPITQCILLNDADINLADDQGNTPLMHAVYISSQTIVDILLSRGAEVNSKNSTDRTALDYSFHDKTCDITSKLIKVGADINIADMLETTSFHILFYHRELEKLRLLFKAAPFYHLEDVYKSRLLHLSVLYNFPAGVDLLTQYGIDINYKNPQNDTVLHVALESNWYSSISERKSMATFLISKGANPGALSMEEQKILL